VSDFEAVVNYSSLVHES